MYVIFMMVTSHILTCKVFKSFSNVWKIFLSFHMIHLFKVHMSRLTCDPRLPWFQMFGPKCVFLWLCIIHLSQQSNRSTNLLSELLWVISHIMFAMTISLQCRLPTTICFQKRSFMVVKMKRKFCIVTTPILSSEMTR